MADQSIIRISKEISDIQKNSDLSIGVACRDVDVRNVKALIIGPPESPYEFGFFEFAVRFNKDYPRKSPAVTAVTTNAGRCRFNPNIYASGKVCLSILGTWRGERGEEWSAAQGLESILLSIQSLMSSNPYENEPGFENANQPSDKRNQKDYVEKIRHETIRISVIQRLEEYLGLLGNGVISQNLATFGKKSNKRSHDRQEEDEDSDETTAVFDPFRDLCKRRFLWYYDTYLASVTKGKLEKPTGTPFVRMPFEGSSNSMEGRFIYAELENRLQVIKQALDKEPIEWAEEGLVAKAKETTVAVNIQHQFGQIVEYFKQNGAPHDLQFENGNPFVWAMTYFGQPMTNLDGGLFRIKIRFSTRFPVEQPRVTLETKIFHHRIAADGTLCYTPNPIKQEDIKMHIEAIVAALEDEEPAYDPRTLVNPEAHKMYWGGTECRRQYNRRLRRSVQQSIEEFC